VELQQLDEQAIKEHLAPAPDHDFEKDDFARLTLDRDLPDGKRWWTVDCPEGHKHVIAWDGKEPTVFECDASGAKYAVTPESDTDPEN
jgi:hypothetical protein